MNYKKLSQTNKILFWIILLGTFTFAQTNWVGNYEFYEDGGKTAGGTKIFIMHKLKVVKDGENLKAHLTGNGYMTHLNLYADAKIEGNKLNLYFQKLGDKDSMGAYLKKGDLLLVLEEKALNGKTQILTYWNKYEAGFPNNEASGKVYFEKSPPNDAITEKDLIGLKESIKDSMLLTYEISQSPLRELTKTKDVQEEAKKYFQAWIEGDAETILAYRPPHQINTDIGTVKFTREIFKEKNADKPIEPLELIKITLKGMSEDTFKYNSVKIGEIVETGILNYGNAPKENIFSLIKFQADVYFKGKKDIINSTVVGYTDGTKWYFLERQGVPENMLKVLKSGSSTEIDEYFKPNDSVESKSDEEQRIREKLQKFRYVYVAKVKVINQTPSGGGIKKMPDGSTRIVDTFRVNFSNRLVIEKVFKGTKRNFVNLNTSVFRNGSYFTFEEGEKYLIYSNSYRTFDEQNITKLEYAEDEIKILNKILNEKK